MSRPAIPANGEPERGGVRWTTRFAVLAPGLFLGALFALVVATTQMPSAMRGHDRLTIWAAVFGGPIFGTMIGEQVGTFLGWLGLLMALAHPIRPCERNGVVTFIGLGLWFFAGFVLVMMVVWMTG